MAEFTIRAISDPDRQWVKEFIEQNWGADEMVVHGEVLTISRVPGLVAEMDGERVGYLSYRISGTECEITSLDSLREGLGIGSRLIETASEIAREAGCTRLFLVTTNDNIHALRYYQRRGFVLSALRPNAVAESRKIKPSIPLIGEHGIPIRDEIELSMDL